MKFLKSYENGNFEKYISYLMTIQNKLTEEIYDFASDPNRHNFSKESLHDSWLKNVEINFDFQKRTSFIQLILLGAYHDREFILSFSGVRQFNICQGLADIERDLLTFEILSEPNDYEEEQIVFNARFSGEDRHINIFCEELKIIEQQLQT